MKKKKLICFVHIWLIIISAGYESLAQTPNWKAQWIAPGLAEDSAHPCPVFKKTFPLQQEIRKATLYITAHGLYEATLNGKRIGDAYFTPGWTSYNKRLLYQAYNVTRSLQKGMNNIQVTIGDGWYRGVFGPWMNNNNYGTDGSLLFQLEIIFKDGSKALVVSDSSWKSSQGSIRYSGLYDGEVQDLRIRPSQWNNVSIQEFDLSNLEADNARPVMQHEQFKPLKIFKTPEGDQVIDFGQNIAGFVSCRLTGKAGDTIKISHAEILNRDGNFYTGNLREASAKDIYVLSGKSRELLEPHFTYHGFRYIKIEGISNPKLEDFTAVALYSALDQTGSFSCSDTMINRLQQNILWSQKANFFSIPTDCPQRSERLGWTGDAQVFCRTAAFNMDVRDFFSGWLKDLAFDQGANGAVPNTIPDIINPTLKRKPNGVAGWGDAATIIPWTMYTVYGDTGILAQQYPSMKAWVDYINWSARDYLWAANGYGDWYAPDTAKTALPFIDQCFFIHSTEILLNTAMVLDKKDDIQTYTGLLQKAKQAFLKTYIPLPKTQTACVLALQFDLLPDSLRKPVAEQLVSLIKSNRDHLATGFLGTPYLLQVLSESGHTGLAYTLLNQDTPPSWLYPLKKGATSIWEKWNAIKPDGSLDTCSLNHYAYGAVGDWLYRTVAGIDAASPGYKQIIIKPQPGGGLHWAKASFRCRYGLISSSWKMVDGKFFLDVAIPPSTTAVVYLPNGEQKQIGPGSHHFQ